MMTLHEALAGAGEKKVAIGHFNVSDSIQFEAIVEAVTELGVPVMVGVSEGERKWFGVAEIAALVSAKRAKGLPVFLNADHTRSFEGITEALGAGFDEVLFDGSALAIEENIAMAKRVVAAARVRAVPGIVEGELGYIGTASEVREGIPENIQKTTLEDAARFVQETSIDLLAPAVGNIHGMMKDGTDPALDIDLIRAIAAAVPVPLVLHGASGNTDSEVWAAIEAGIRVVHINTEIRAAYRKGIESGLAAHPDEVAPYKYLAEGKEELKRVVIAKLKLFNHLS